MSDITHYIPYGRANAVTRKALADLTGMSDRDVRRAITKARETSLIINLQDKQGYFRPCEDEMHYAYDWIRQEKARARTINKSILAAEIECGARIDEG